MITLALDTCTHIFWVNIYKVTWNNDEVEPGELEHEVGRDH